MAARESDKDVAKPNVLTDPPEAEVQDAQSADKDAARDASAPKSPALERVTKRVPTDIEDSVFRLEAEAAAGKIAAPKPEAATPAKAEPVAEPIAEKKAPVEPVADKKQPIEPAALKAPPGEPRPANPEVRVDSSPQPWARPRASRDNAPTFYVAGFWRRLLAGAIDSAIILPVSLIMCWLAGALANLHLPSVRHRGFDFWLDLLLSSDPALLGAIGLILAVAAVYLLVFQITLGRTLGMKVLKIRIIDVYGDNPSTMHSALRTAGYLAGVGTLGLGFLWVGFDSEKRGLHDWISSTYVVKA